MYPLLLKSPIKNYLCGDIFKDKFERRINNRKGESLVL